MSIGKFLLNAENLALVKKLSWKFGRPKIIELGLEYYANHPDDVATIKQNLEHFGLPADPQAVTRVLTEIVAHYYEKLFVLVKTYEAYWIARNRIELGDSLAPFEEARRAGKSVFVGQSHFGATYLKFLVLMARGFDVHVVGKFPEPAGSMLAQTTRLVTERYGAGQATILNIADPTVDVPLEMIRLLSRPGTILSNVFDENNALCRPMDLLGTQVMGGTGMDLILKRFSDDQVTVVTPFLIRTSDETFRYEIDRHRLAAGDIIASFFGSLERRIKAHFEQWYFIHEVHESLVRESAR